MLFKTDFFGLTLETGILPWLNTILSIKFCFLYHAQKWNVQVLFPTWSAKAVEANNNDKTLFSDPYTYPLSKTLSK